MSTAPIHLSDMLPMKEQPHVGDPGREACRWVIAFLSIDTSGREIGRDMIRLGVPTRVDTRTYISRNEDVDTPIEIKVPFHVPLRNYAGPAVETMLADFQERGLREIVALRGKDSRNDAEFVKKLILRVLPDPFDFDGAEDKDWALFERRREHLTRMLAEESPDSVEAGFIQTLIDANNGTENYLMAFFQAFFADAEQKRLHGAMAGGRTRMFPDEIRMCKWLKLRPTKFIDGYDDGTQVGMNAPQAAPQMIQLPPELLDAMKIASEGKDERIAALEAQLEQMKNVIAAVAANRKPPEERDGKR